MQSTQSVVEKHNKQDSITFFTMTFLETHFRFCMTRKILKNFFPLLTFEGMRLSWLLLYKLTFEIVKMKNSPNTKRIRDKFKAKRSQLIYHEIPLNLTFGCVFNFCYWVICQWWCRKILRVLKSLFFCCHPSGMDLKFISCFMYTFQ